MEAVLLWSVVILNVFCASFLLSDPITTDETWQRVTVEDNPTAFCSSSTGTWQGRRNIVQDADKDSRIFQLLSALTIRDFEASDADEFICVENNGTVIKNCTFYQDVSFSKDTVSVQEIVAGTRAEIVCGVEGSEQIDKTMLKNSTVYLDVEEKRHGFGWIRPVRKEDGGEYVCQASQEIRGDRKTIEKFITVVVDYPSEMSLGTTKLVNVPVIPKRSIGHLVASTSLATILCILALTLVIAVAA